MKRLPLLLLLISLGFGQAWAADPPTGPWHPEITARPRLLFYADDLSTLQDRITREPYITLMQRVRSRANSGYSPTPSDPYSAPREYSNANIAKAAAFAAWIDNDADLADKAATVLEVMAPDVGTMTLQLIDYDIHVAEAIIAYCDAYDILAGSGLVGAERLAGIEALLGGMVADWYAKYADLFAIVEQTRYNNHQTKTASAFAMAGMTLNQRDDSNKWFNYGMGSAYDVMFNYLLHEEGADAEGPYYYEYSAVDHLPMFIAYDRLIGADAWILKRGLCLIGPNCPWDDYYIVNPLDHPKTYAGALWAVKSRMPDGSQPPLDDADPTGSLNGLLATHFQDGLLAWEWLNNDRDPLFSEHCSAIEVDLIAAYDDAVPVTPPDENFGPHFVLAGAGEAFLRSGWDAEDAWAMFIAEYNQPRVMGSMHEHADNLSVSLFARGQYLLLDPGYIAWDYHDLVRMGVHHNVPTVDGQGPPAPIGKGKDLFGADAFIADSKLDIETPFVTGISSWNNADFTRTLFFPENDYLVVIDDMVSGASHTFGVLWHGQAGGDSGFPFELLVDGGSWRPNDAAVDVHVAATTGDLIFNTLTNIHSFQWMQQIQHTSLDAHADATVPHARFISVALPYNLGTETPREVYWLNGDNAVAARIEGENIDFVLAQTEPELQQFTADETGTIDLETSATSLFLQTDDTAQAGTAYFSGGYRLQLGDKRAWSFAAPARVWLEWDGDTWTFYFAEGPVMLKTETSVTPAILSRRHLQWEVSGGELRIYSKTATKFKVIFPEDS